MLKSVEYKNIYGLAQVSDILENPVRRLKKPTANYNYSNSRAMTCGVKKTEILKQTKFKKVEKDGPVFGSRFGPISVLNVLN